MYPDGCGGWCHYSSPDLFHWTQHAPLPKLGGLTGSLSFTSEEEGLLLLHPKGGDWIARAVPNGTDAAKLDDFDDSSCRATPGDMPAPGAGALCQRWRSQSGMQWSPRPTARPKADPRACRPMERRERPVARGVLQQDGSVLPLHALRPTPVPQQAARPSRAARPPRQTTATRGAQDPILPRVLAAARARLGCVERSCWVFSPALAVHSAHGARSTHGALSVL